MTENRVKHLQSELSNLQRDMYYRNEWIDSLEELLKVVNGNKDRLILILTALLIEQNPECGVNPQVKKKKIKNIILNL